MAGQARLASESGALQQSFLFSQKNCNEICKFVVSPPRL